MQLQFWRSSELILAKCQGKIINAPPPPPPHFGQKTLFREGGGGVYILKPPAAGFYTPPPLLYAPHPLRVFSGVGGVGVYKIRPCIKVFWARVLLGSLWGSPESHFVVCGHFRLVVSAVLEGQQSHKF